MREKCEFLIVGSGAGGATLARELSKKGRRVLVIERGRVETRLGTVRDTFRYYDLNRVTRTLRRSREGTILLRAFMAGGSTSVSSGSGVRSLERELSEIGIDLSAEFLEAEKELGVSPLDERLLSGGSLAIRQAAEVLGYEMELMPKFIDSVKCFRDSACSMGCPSGARWSAVNYLEEAKSAGAEILYNTVVDRVEVENGRATGVTADRPRGRARITAPVVILAAGGLETPLLLQRSGISEAGTGLFADIFRRTYGVAEGINLLHEPEMALINRQFYSSQGFILTPSIVPSRIMRLAQTGLRAFLLSGKKMIGLMTIIRDENTGRIFEDGSISKPVTKKDWDKLEAGASIAREILIRAGADPDSIINDSPGGAHPGGTAAIGTVVDSSLQTEIEGLFVCDASVLPVAPGLPPIVTIVAMAKRMAKALVN